MHQPASKSELRKLLRERRQAIPGPQRRDAAIRLAEYLDQVLTARSGDRIAIYLPADGEIDTRPLAKRCRGLGVELFLPVVSSDGVMHFAPWEPGAILQVNRYGIPEPGPEYPIRDADELDIVFMPLVAWDEYGNRLGMGGGFYDRALRADRKPLRVGLGFECQRTEQIQADAWDIPMDFVATEADLYKCRGRFSPG